MRNQASRQLVIGVTYTLDVAGTKGAMSRVSNARGENVTNDLRIFFHQRSMALLTQQEIEYVAREFIEARNQIFL